MISGQCKSIFRLCGLLALVLALGACGRGPFSPEAREQAADLNQYLKTLQAALVRDDTFEWNTLSSALIVRSMVYSGRVRAEAERRFAEAPPFQKDQAEWLRPLKKRSGEPIVILMGFFTPDLKEKDLTKLGRFRPRLVAGSGRVLEPLEIRRYGRDSVFMRDYFPVFNLWEEVYVVRFPSAGVPAGPLEFRLEWPGGLQTLTLDR